MKAKEARKQGEHSAEASKCQCRGGRNVIECTKPKAVMSYFW